MPYLGSRKRGCSNISHRMHRLAFRYILYISAPIYAFGFLWFILRGEYSLGDVRVARHVSAATLFFFGFVLGGLLANFLFFSHQRNKGSFMARVDAERFNQALNYLGFLCCFFIGIYIVDNGMVKILALGSNVDGSDFRYIGLNHHNKWVQMPMELSRRAMMPFVILSKLSVNRIHLGLGRKTLSIFIGVFFLASIINLDRGPMFVFFIMMGFYLWHSTKNPFKKLYTVMIFLPIVAVMGWVFTLAQYNNLSLLNIQSFLDTLFGLLVNRIILSPVIMGQTWVYDYPHDPLFLEYARISVLWGGEYVGSHSYFSWHVAPVGVIGDIERNFGTAGMLPFGLFVGVLLMFVQNATRSVQKEAQIPLHFVELILAIYLIHGGIFSLGPPALIVFLLGASLSLKILYRGHY